MMPHPGNLVVQTNALGRLIKEEKSYYLELKQQEHSVSRLEKINPEEISDPTEKENHGYTLKQEKQALEETKAVIPPLRKKIEEAIGTLEAVVNETEEDTPEVLKARDVLRDAQRAAEPAS